MNWVKKGLIYCPEKYREWIDNSVLTPQPFLLNKNVIRVYASFRDKSGIGRIGYIDLDAKNPANIMKISEVPVLDLGEKGCFDDNGMLLGDVIRVDDKIYMYYVGFQIPSRAKFLAFSGLAVSEDNGETFSRVQNTPVLDRSGEGIFGRCIHSVIYEKDIFKVWYSVIFSWVNIENVDYPAYDIRYIESKNGIDFDKEGISCIKCSGNEYRIGRPKVRKIRDGYEMRYTYDTFSKEYKSGFATSLDGTQWQRQDNKAWLEKSASGFDSMMACYPVVMETEFATYMFYCGNYMGKGGFGYAELIEE